MIVVAGTSPLHYLVLVGEAHVLPELFQQVLIPQEVFEELIHAGTPPAVRDWASMRPEWLEIRFVDASSSDPIPELDTGEEAAIRLALEHQSVAFVLMDDAKGRREAGKRGLRTTGTLGVLRAASRSGLLSLRAVLPRLLQTNFYVPSTLVEALIEEEGPAGPE
jgi:predicted nucleic acid-binding protein